MPHSPATHDRSYPILASCAGLLGSSPRELSRAHADDRDYGKWVISPLERCPLQIGTGAPTYRVAHRPTRAYCAREIAAPARLGVAMPNNLSRNFHLPDNPTAASVSLIANRLRDQSARGLVSPKGYAHRSRVVRQQTALLKSRQKAPSR